MTAASTTAGFFLLSSAPTGADTRFFFFGEFLLLLGLFKLLLTDSLLFRFRFTFPFRTLRFRGSFDLTAGCTVTWPFSPSGGSLTASVGELCIIVIDFSFRFGFLLRYFVLKT
jgi:hypothetical protein